VGAVGVTLLCLVGYLLAYFLYARRLGRRVFLLSPDRPTPAHVLEDGIDYVPSHRAVLFGHHYASVAGLSPMLGPAIAVIWGWLPGLLWVFFGSVLIGAVHDLGALVLSIRARGLSVGMVAEQVIGKRAKTLFHILIFFLISFAMGVFILVVSGLFSRTHPEAVIPTLSLMLIAVGVGYLSYRRRFRLAPLTAIAFLLALAAVGVGLRFPMIALSGGTWNFVLLVYCFLASVLPVWQLLQPRDYINSFLLYLGLGSMFAGFFLLGPQFQAPAVQIDPVGAPPIFPFVFIVIACGAISGFHGLVSSGTTAKQLDRETDAVFIGYGGMLGESLLGLIAVLACTAGFATSADWAGHYRDWEAASSLAGKLGAFIDGAGMFIHQLGVPLDASRAFVAFIAVSFALTSLDSATRLLRFNISEMSGTLRLPILENRYVASLFAVGAMGFFAYYRIDGQPAGLVLWQLFGTTNQVLGALVLLAVSVYLIQRKLPCRYTLVPMLFMLVTTVVAMILKVRDFQRDGQWLLLGLGLAILVLTVWLTVEAALRLYRVFQSGHSAAPMGLQILPGRDPAAFPSRD
jgi:carbon starvation protein